MEIKVGRVSVDLLEEGDRICGHIRSGKTFETDSLKIWGDLCERGGIVLDIGAYTGLFTIAAAKYGCSVHAFEPLFFNFQRLKLNVENNKDLFFGGVHLHEAAVTNVNGTGHIFYNPKVAFTSGASLLRKSGERLDIQLMTIDSMDLQQVTAIKIDVERGEPLVLAGARETIARCRPAILIEVLDKERKDAVRKALPDYTVDREIDERNWLMLPC